MGRLLGIARTRWAAAVVLCVGIAVAWPARGQAVTDSELKARVQSEYPDIVNANDWDRIMMLREYSYRHSSYATSITTTAYARGERTVFDILDTLKTLGDGYRFFDEAQGGQVCGGVSIMLWKLYELYGYPATTLSIGWSPQFPSPSGSDFGHVQAIAAIGLVGKTYRVVSDAIMNFTYAWPDGGPIDYHDMVWLLAQNQADRISTRGATDGTGNNPQTLLVGFYSDQPDDSVGLSSSAVDPQAYTIVRSFDRWVYQSRRTVARFERLGDLWWKPQLVREGRPGETIYLHTFPYDPLGTAELPNSVFAPQNTTDGVFPSDAQQTIGMPIVGTAERILADFRSIAFSYRDGFGGISKGPGINNVALRMNAQFSLANDSCTNGCGVGLFPVPSQTAPDATLYFQPRNGVVAGQITFPTAALSVAVDLISFGGATVTMTAYDEFGSVVAMSTATDQTGNNRLGVTATTGRKIEKVVLRGSSGNRALNIKNVQIRALGPTTRFAYGEGFKTGGNPGINTVAAGMNALFSLGNDACTNGCGVGLYPIPTAASPNSSSLYFAPRGGAVSGQITFLTPVSAVALDVTYFNGGTVTMTAYDASWNVLQETSGTDQPGENHLAVTANPGHTNAIKYVRVHGVNGNTAINIKHVMQFTWL